MALIEQNQGEITKTGDRVQLRKTTLASMESLDIPMVQEVVFLADFRCARCQQRIAEVMSKMNGETQSIMVSVLEKKVTLTTTHHKPARVSAAGIASISKIALMLRLLRPSHS